MDNIEIRGLDELLKKLDRISTYNPEQTLAKMAAYAKTKILQRTASGKDYLDRTFKPYTDATKKTRSKAGLPINHPDLLESGRMLGSLSFYVQKDSAHLFFLNPHDALKAYANNKTREFFAINDKDEKSMTAIAETDIIKALKL